MPLQSLSRGQPTFIEGHHPETYLIVPPRLGVPEEVVAVVVEEVAEVWTGWVVVAAVCVEEEEVVLTACVVLVVVVVAGEELLQPVMSKAKIRQTTSGIHNFFINRLLTFFNCYDLISLYYKTDMDIFFHQVEIFLCLVE